MQKTTEISEGEIHLWVAFPEEISDTALLRSYEDLMNREEKALSLRFRFERHRRQHIITRALVRTTLSRYAKVHPGALGFEKNEYGRPELLYPKGTGLRFNLSHAEGLVVCAVTRFHDIGVDAEYMEREGLIREVAERFFSPLEVEAIYTLPEAQRREKFFHYWTLKESYIKARGLGLSLPLDQFAFHISGGSGLEISFGRSVEDDPGRWSFWLYQPTRRHSMAVSVKRGDKPLKPPEARKVVPLKGESPFFPELLNYSTKSSIY